MSVSSTFLAPCSNYFLPLYLSSLPLPFFGTDSLFLLGTPVRIDSSNARSSSNSLLRVSPNATCTYRCPLLLCCIHADDTPSISVQNLLCLSFLAFPLSILYPPIITGAGDFCYLTKHTYSQPVILFLHAFLDHRKLPSDTHDFFLLPEFSAIVIFFKNSTSCRRYFTSFHTRSMPSEHFSETAILSFIHRFRFSPSVKP